MTTTARENAHPTLIAEALPMTDTSPYTRRAHTKRLRRSSSLALAFLALLAPAARAQIDLVEQDIVIDVDVDGLSVTTTATIAVIQSTSSMIIYTPNPPVVSVTVDGAEAVLSPYPGYVGLVSIVTFPTTLQAGSTAEIVLDLSGVPDCSSYYGPQYDGCIFDAGALVLPPPGPGQGWYLTNLLEVDVFTGTISVTASADRTVIAGQGAPVDIIDEGDGRQTSVFANTVPTETIGVVARPFETVRAVGELDVSIHFVDPAHTARLTEAATLAVDVGAVFEDLFGALPFDHVSYTMVPGFFPFAGMGMIGNIWFVDYLLAPQFAEIIDQGVGHELAHTWWGGLSSSGEYASGPFFNEAFAEYSLWRGLGELQGDDVRMSGVRMNTLWYITGRPGDQDHPVVDDAVTDSPVYVHVTYHKGSSVLRMLEEHVGIDAFTDVLKAQVARGPGGTSIADLIADIDSIAGVDVSDLVEQFLFGKGYPEIRVSAARVDDASTLEIAVDGQPSLGRLFAFGLPLRIHHADGSVEQKTVNVQTGTQSVALEGASAPVLVEVDPEWAIVRTVQVASSADVSFDGDVDGIDLIEVMWRNGGVRASERRKDGRFDPLYDLDGDGRVDDDDTRVVLAAFEG
jgi:hypothetical protein